ncbi:MAG: hypothetical protein O2816_06320 [Planctomycetota bacterium]|nr:hypothetical protein [Planctomycetota bacterium]
MTALDRRTLLGATAALTLLPRTLAAQWEQEKRDAGHLAKALSSGHAAGKPVLVLRVPEERANKFARGVLFGALLHNASDALLEALPLAEVVCATRTELAQLHPHTREQPEVFAWLVETPGAPVAVREVLAEMPAMPRFDWPGEPLAEERRQVRDWVRPLERALLAALVADTPRVHQRAAAVNASGRFRAPARSRLLSEPCEAEIEDVLAGAALLYRASLGVESETSPHRAALRNATRQHLLEATVAGSRWASHEGCGVEVDGDGPPGVECGMGYVPAAARRLLWFYTEQRGR